MLFDLIFLGLMLAGWLLCAYVPWVVASILTRGHAGLRYLPLCLFAGVAGALAVPVLGADGASGLWASFGVAAAVPTVLLAARRVSLPAVHRPPARSLPPERPK